MKTQNTLMHTTIKDMGLYDDELPVLNLQRMVRHLYNNYQPIGGEIYTELAKYIAVCNTVNNSMDFIFNQIMDVNSRYTRELCNKPTMQATDRDSLLHGWTGEINMYNHLNANCCRQYQENIKRLSNHMQYILLELFNFMEESYHKSKIDYHTLTESNLDFVIKAPRQLKLGSHFDMIAYDKLLMEQEDTIAYNFTSVKTLTDFIFNGKETSLAFFNAPNDNADSYISKAIEYFYNDITIDPIGKTIDEEEYRQCKITESIVNHTNINGTWYSPKEISDTAIMDASISYQYAYFIAKKICVVLKIINELKYV